MGFFRRAYCVPYGGRGPPLKYQLQTDDPSSYFLSFLFGSIYYRKKE